MERTTQETQGLYWFGLPLWCNTLLQCVVWWIASCGDDDEQYKEEQPREGLFLAGGDELLGGVQSPFSLSRISIPLPTMVASPIYRGPGPLPKYRAGRRPTMRANLKGDS